MIFEHNVSLHTSSTASVNQQWGFHTAVYVNVGVNADNPWRSACFRMNTTLRFMFILMLLNFAKCSETSLLFCFGCLPESHLDHICGCVKHIIPHTHQQKRCPHQYRFIHLSTSQHMQCTCGEAHSHFLLIRSKTFPQCRPSLWDLVDDACMNTPLCVLRSRSSEELLFIIFFFKA